MLASSSRKTMLASLKVPELVAAAPDVVSRLDMADPVSDRMPDIVPVSLLPAAISDPCLPLQDPAAPTSKMAAATDAARRAVKPGIYASSLRTDLNPGPPATPAP